MTRLAKLVALVAITATLTVGSVGLRGPEADAGEPPAGGNVLALNDGGQFVFWSLGPAQASDVFTTVVIAWLFNSTAINWTSFIPVLGTVDFTLADGDVLWVVSDGVQEIAVGDGPPPEEKEPPPPEDETVTSGDGLAQLTIPDGALPDGTSAADLRITSQPELLGGAILAAYQLEPRGLVFNQPVTLAVAVDAPGAALLGVLAGVETLETPAFELAVDPNGDTAIRTELSHLGGMLTPEGRDSPTIWLLVDEGAVLEASGAGDGQSPFVGLWRDVDWDPAVFFLRFLPRGSSHLLIVFGDRFLECGDPEVLEADDGPAL